MKPPSRNLAMRIAIPTIGVVLILALVVYLNWESIYGWIDDFINPDQTAWAY